MSDRTEPRVVSVAPATVAVLRETVPMAGLRDYYDRAYHTVMRVVQERGAAPTGPPVGIYYSMPTETVDVAAGFPVDHEVPPADGVTTDTLPGGRAVQVEHHGPYDSMVQTYTRLLEWVQAQGLSLGQVMWETYVTDPTPEVDPESMVTLITWPLAD